MKEIAMQWFGNPWPSAEFRATVCEDDSERVPVPPGEICMMCRQVLQPEDQGVLLPHMASDGIPEKHFYHIDCLMRNILGE